MKRVCIVAFVAFLFPQYLAGQEGQVLTQHNDNGRTGANLSETQLNVANVSSGNFGWLFSLPVDGAVYAQPLYVPRLSFPDGAVHNVLYVATMHNNVYAYDADTGILLWQKNQKNLGPFVPQNFMPMAEAAAGRSFNETITEIVRKLTQGCAPEPAVPNQPQVNIKGGYGITSTPVIDPTSNTIYLVAKTSEPGEGFLYRLHALDLVTGNEKDGGPVTISGQVPGNGSGSEGGTLTFDPKMHLQRPGLLLSQGAVYIAFGAHQDTPTYHGWIFAYDAKTLQQKAVFSTTPNGDEGGIWQSGNGLAADPSGNIYFMTGNGTFSNKPGLNDLGDSFIKLDRDLNIIDWFTPQDFDDMDQSDVDLGSAGPLLFPFSSSLVGGGKKGVFYLLDQNNLGHLEDDQHPPLQKFQASQGVDNTFVDTIGAGFVAAAAWQFFIGDIPGALGLLVIADAVFSTNLCGFDYHHIHGSPVTWTSPKDGPLVYVWGERDKLKAFKFDPAGRRFPSTSPAYTSSMKDPDSSDFTQKFMPGGILSVSANGSAPGTGILWASVPETGNALAALAQGDLRAFDAANIGHELWCASVGTFAKFNAPTIVNGKVYLATFDNRVNAYGVTGRKSFQTGFNNTWLGGYNTKSSPFVSNGYVYFQGKGSGDKDDRLYKVNVDNPNGDNTWLGGYNTKSSPFVSNGYVYFQGKGSGDKDDRLYKVNINNPNGDNTWLGGYNAKSSPFVSNGYVYFQGKGSGDKDDRLYKVNVNNPNGDNTWLGGYNTKSSPFVSNGYVYFQGKGSGDKDDRLYKVNINNPNGDNTWLGGYNAKSSPFVSNGYVYFQGKGSGDKDDRLYKVNVDNPNGDNTWLGGYKTKSSPFVDGTYVYFRGTDDQLWRVSTDGTGLASPGCGNWTEATPFVYGNSIFFRGTDDRLLMVGAYE